MNILVIPDVPVIPDIQEVPNAQWSTIPEIFRGEIKIMKSTIVRIGKTRKMLHS